MTSDIDHARCSELLMEYARGSLDAVQSEQVKQHLARCPDCTSELRVAETLAADGAGLTPRERAALQQHVMAAIGEGDGGTVAAFEPVRPGRARLAQVLGAAAAVAVFGTLLYLSATSGGEADQMGTALVERGGADSAESEGGAGSAPEALSDKTSSKDSGTAGSAAGAAAQEAEAPTPSFTVSEDPITGDDLERLGRSGLETVRFAHYYSSDDAGGADALVDELAAAASATSSTEDAAQIVECAGQVLESDDPTLPTFGMIANYSGGEALILGFVWTTSDRGPLDRYMVWAWKRGTCDVTIEYIDGKVETAG